MKATSSSAKTLVGSDIASVSVPPIRLTGSTSYFFAMCDGHQPVCLAVDVQIGQGDGGDAVLAGEEADQLLFADEAQANEDRAELVRLALLLGQGLTQLLFLDEPLGDEEVAEATDHMLPEFNLGHSELLL